jgi:hypothetical protein
MLNFESVGLCKKTKKTQIKKRKKTIKNRYRSKILINAFWYKKFEKCNINIKKIRPTPKSITHKNPIKISASSNKSKKPKPIK